MVMQVRSPAAVLYGTVPPNARGSEPAIAEKIPFHENCPLFFTLGICCGMHKIPTPNAPAVFFAGIVVSSRKTLSVFRTATWQCSRPDPRVAEGHREPMMIHDVLQREDGFWEV